jgi:hypothetical protein
MEGEIELRKDIWKIQGWDRRRKGKENKRRKKN